MPSIVTSTLFRTGVLVAMRTFGSFGMSYTQITWKKLCLSGSCFSDLLGRISVKFRGKLIIPLYWSKTFLALSKPHQLWRSFVCWSRHHPLMLCVQGTLLSNPFGNRCLCLIFFLLFLFLLPPSSLCLSFSISFIFHSWWSVRLGTPGGRS